MSKAEFKLIVNGESYGVFDTLKEAQEEAPYLSHDDEVEIVKSVTVKTGKVVQPDSYVEWR